MKYTESQSENMFIVSAGNHPHVNGLTIRIAEDDDAEKIEPMICRWTRTDKRRERVESIREAVKRDGHEIIVAELEGRIIGVLHLIVYSDVMLGGHNSQRGRNCSCWIFDLSELLIDMLSAVLKS